MKNIVTVTLNPAIDTGSSVDRVVADKKLRCQTPSHEPGGGGLNISRVISRLGGTSKAVFTSGGIYGKWLEELLDFESVDSVAVHIEDETRENIMILDESGGQQFRFTMPGPSLSEHEWQECLNQIEKLSGETDYLAVSGSLPEGVPMEFLGHLARMSNRHDMKLVVDTSGDALKHALDQGVYLIKPNMRELQDIVGRKIENESQQNDVVQEIVNSGKAQVVVLSLGAAGVLLATSEGIRRLRAPSVTIKSKVGAGDSMVAGIVLALAQDRGIDEAVLFGLAAGTAAVMTEGSQLCRKEDTEKLFDQLKHEFEQSGQLAGTR